MLPCINHATLMTTGLEEFLAASAAAGFRLVELRQPMVEAYLAELPPGMLRHRLEGLGLSVASLNALMEWSLTPEENFSSALKRAERLFALCETVGTDLLVCVPDLVSPATLEGFPGGAVVDMTAARLKRLAAQARLHGVRLALEQVGRPSSRPDCVSSVRRIEDALAILEAAGEPNLCLALDSFNYFTGGNSAESLALVSLSRIGILHAADAPSPDPTLCGGERLMPGEGKLDLPGFYRAMADKGYDGPWSVELFNSSVWGRPAGESALVAMASLLRLLNR